MRPSLRLLLLGSTLLFGCTVNSFPDSKDALGALVLSIRGDFSELRTQSVITDISTLSIKVQARDLAVQSHDFSAAELANASPSVQFNSLRTGLATISIKVVDANAQQIGTSTATASIVRDAVTPVSLTVQLNPTYTEAGHVGLGLSVGAGDEVLVPQGGQAQ